MDKHLAINNLTTRRQMAIELNRFYVNIMLYLRPQ